MKNVLLGLFGAMVFSCSPSEHSSLDAGDNVKPIGDYSTQKGESVFSLGNGFNELKRQVNPFMCLDSAGLMVQTDRISFLESRSEIIKGKRELVERLDINVNVGVNGVYRFITGDVSTAVNFARQSNVSSDTIMVVVEYNYIDNKKMIYARSPNFLDDVIYTSMEEFRQDCGDKYLSEIEVGARLYYVFTSEYSATTNKSKAEVESAIKAGFGEMFNINTSSKVTKEQEEIFSQTNISIHCLTQGVADPTVCSSRHEVTGDSDQMNKILGSLELAFTSAVKDHPDFIVVKQKFRDYPIGKLFEVDDIKAHRATMGIRLDNVEMLIEESSEADAICSEIDYNSKECERFTGFLKDLMDSCMEPDPYEDEVCNSPIDKSILTEDENMKNIIADASPGYFELYEHSRLSGRRLRVNFSDMYSDYATFKPNQYYNLTDARFDFNDILSSYRWKLRDGWQVRFFEHHNGSGRQFVLKGGSGTAYAMDHALSNTQWAQATITSFILERYED